MWLTWQVWNLETTLPIQTLTRHEASVHSVALQGDLLFSASEDKDVKVPKMVLVQFFFSMISKTFALIV